MWSTTVGRSSRALGLTEVFETASRPSAQDTSTFVCGSIITIAHFGWSRSKYGVEFHESSRHHFYELFQMAWITPWFRQRHNTWMRVSPGIRVTPFTPIIPDLVKMFLACDQNNTISTLSISMNKSKKARVLKVPWWITTKRPTDAWVACTHFKFIVSMHALRNFGESHGWLQELQINLVKMDTTCDESFHMHKSSSSSLWRPTQTNDADSSNESALYCKMTRNNYHPRNALEFSWFCLSEYLCKVRGPSWRHPQDAVNAKPALKYHQHRVIF